MATPFHVEIVTPERILYAGEAEEVSMRTEEGEIAFLARHEDFVGAIDITVVRVTPVLASGEAADAGAELRVAVHGGFVHVDERQVTVLAGVAELGTQIDLARARRALEAAEAQVAIEGPPTAPGGDGAPQPLAGAMIALLAPESAEAARRRARVRLEAAGAQPAS